MSSSEFKELSLEELTEILGITIKRDRVNKVITFLCFLSAYSGSSFNLSFNSPSSSGKSYIPLEILELIPKEDTIVSGYTSPSAFFHEFGEWDSERKIKVINWRRKILVFLDQPRSELLERLRPVLSHDCEEVIIRITDKTDQHGFRTKNISILGHPAVVFCSTSYQSDDQERTRFILLSAETDQQKLREGIHEKSKKEADGEAYKQWVESHPERQALKERVREIREANIQNVLISSPEKVEELFYSRNRFLKPRHMRDVGRLYCLVKTWTILNMWFRERDGLTLVASEDDIKTAFTLWNEIAETQELGLSPYPLQVYREVVLPVWERMKYGHPNLGVKIGITKKDIRESFNEVYGTSISDKCLKRQILDPLEDSGIIIIEADVNDKRRILIYPLYNPQPEVSISNPKTKENPSSIPQVEVSISDGVVEDSRGHCSQIQDPGGEGLPAAEPRPERNLTSLVENAIRKKIQMLTSDMGRWLERRYEKFRLKELEKRMWGLAREGRTEELDITVKEYGELLVQIGRAFRGEV